MPTNINLSSLFWRLHLPLGLVEDCVEAYRDKKICLSFWDLLYFCPFTILRHNSLNLSLPSYLLENRVLRVSVRFFTTLREIVGKKEENLEFPRGKTVTVNALLKHLTANYGKGFSEYIYDGHTGEVKGFLQFLVNGRSITSFNGLDTKLEDGDILAIIPPVGGG